MFSESLQWDLNPEGVGVQPMIAKVDLNFSIIGGSSLDGPIRQLQNAVSFNFFANTSVYNPRRYYDPSDIKIGKDGQAITSYESLEQKLEGQAQNENFRIKGDIIGFGAFKNQSTADLDITNPSPASQLIQTPEDNKDETSGVQTSPADGSDLILPPPPIDIDSDGIPDTIDGEITASPAETLDPTAAFTDGLFGGAEDQQMIKDMYPGAKTPQDDIDDTELYDSYDIKLTELPDTFTETGTISVGNIFFKKPDGSGGIPIKEFGFYLTPEAEDLGYTIQIDVNLKLTYPPNSGIPTENITDRAYIDIAKVITKEGSVYKDYKTLPTDEYNQNSIFDVQRFFTDWFTKDSRFNGVHKLDVTWTFTREVTEETAKEVTTSVGVGKEDVGKLKSKTYTETFEYDLYSEEYQPTPEEVANILSNLPPGTFFP